jgi:hypothetical protein
MTFDTKIAYIVRDDLATWQRLNVVAFLATGIASAAPRSSASPISMHWAGNMAICLASPCLIFEGGLEKLQVVHRKALEREVTIIPYIHAMFATGYDEANREELLWPPMRRIWIWSGWGSVARKKGG